MDSPSRGRSPLRDVMNSGNRRIEKSRNRETDTYRYLIRDRDIEIDRLLERLVKILISIQIQIQIPIQI